MKHIRFRGSKVPQIQKKIREILSGDIDSTIRSYLDDIDESFFLKAKVGYDNDVMYSATVRKSTFERMSKLAQSKEVSVSFILRSSIYEKINISE